jgi:hypothetical protein
MYQSSAEKERLLLALTDIYDQLEELESVLEGSFSDLRIRLKEEEQAKISDTAKKISVLDNKLEKIISFGEGMADGSRLSQSTNVLQLELGY